MLFFAVIMSPLVRALDARLPGVSLPDATGGGARPRFAVSSYVDDVVAVLERPTDGEVLSTTLETFADESGLRVNASKSQAMPLGAWRTDTPLFCDYVDRMRVLGVVFTTRVQDLLAANWEARMTAVTLAVRDARVRALNVVQRVAYANTYVLPLLWHLAAVVPLTAEAVRDVTAELGKFLWAGYPLRVAMDVMVLPADKGGLCLHHPGLKARALFTGRWLTASRSPEASLAGAWLHVLAVLYPPGTSLPLAAGHYRAIREAATVNEDLRGRELNRALYAAALEKHADNNIRAIPRVQRRRPDADWGRVWRCVSSPLHDVAVRDSWFRVAHGVIGTRVMMAATNRADSQLCPECAVPDTTTHHLAECGPNRRTIWRWASTTMAALTGATVPLPPKTMVEPGFDTPRTTKAAAAMWLCGVTVAFLETRTSADVGQFQKFVMKRRAEANIPASVRDVLQRL
ncbi:hypothetical protein ONE63_011469 [Megalurothrips usitatus]|uniref:Reverse transcriptase domain-containing protein n=1 Tax=Megalurothrips usitatus TaxID=439358 RepID=A0AAV7X2Z7_9NEOP|nr:hypothetical protein ONE63_011469 [Megalurothrips usitatus]